MPKNVLIIIPNMNIVDTSLSLKMVMHHFQRKMYAVLLSWQVILLYCSCDPHDKQGQASHGSVGFED